MLYALFGIPLCLTLLGGIGQKLNRLGGTLDLKLNRGIFSPNVGKAVRALIAFVLGLALFILIPAIIINHLEGWGYGISVYYGIITLTTVGLGDFVAGNQIKFIVISMTYR